MSDTPRPIALEDSDRKELLRIARTTLKEWLRTGRLPPGSPHRSPLLARAGAFVTLHVDGELRGCIGHTEPEAPLYKTIIDLSVSAAARDPRFEPLRLEELASTKISISVLSARERVTSADEVEVGRDGLMVTRGPRRGLLLPQVAVEQGWDTATFLAETCRKAGLPPDAWRDPGTLVERFTADLFSE